MVELWISIAIIFTSIIAIIYYLSRNTRIDKVFRKQQNKIKEQKKDDEKTPSVEKSSTENVKVEEKSDNKKVEKKPDVKINESVKNGLNSEKVDIDKIKKDIYEQAIKDLTPEIESKVKSELSPEIEKNIKKKIEDEKNNRHISKQVKELSPEMKAILFTDIIKPKF